MNLDRAPLFLDSYDLAVAVCEHFDDRQGSSKTESGSQLESRIVGTSLDLLDHVTLALKGFETQDNVLRADQDLAMLRVSLRLATELERLSRETFLQLANCLDSIGRQLGGWLKRIDEV